MLHHLSALHIHLLCSLGHAPDDLDRFYPFSETKPIAKRHHRGNVCVSRNQPGTEQYIGTKRTLPEKKSRMEISDLEFITLALQGRMYPRERAASIKFSRVRTAGYYPRFVKLFIFFLFHILSEGIVSGIVN